MNPYIRDKYEYAQMNPYIGDKYEYALKTLYQESMFLTYLTKRNPYLTKKTSVSMESSESLLCCLLFFVPFKGKSLVNLKKTKQKSGYPFWV